ncbi:MAG: HAMP domain-containing histidine kinase, partial [Halobacteriovoraceae bacterium]|nr:HAMP domain-containing histidine kinase [Halobacteriovoraceae bacterium]
LKGGKIQVKPECVTVEGVVERAKLLFQDTLEKKNVTIEKDIPEDNLSFIADEVAFSNHVFNNIISNAIKFSYEGGKIIVKARAIDSENMVIEVKDNGIGMDSSLLSVIFESDKRTSRIGTGGEKGTGFGMPLIKSYVELFGGVVSIESTPDKEGVSIHGTTITLRLKTCWNVNGKCRELPEIA